MSEKPKVPEGPPHGGPDADGYCCGHRTHDNKHVVENRGRHNSFMRWFVEGKWQCHVREDHNGTLVPTPIVIVSMFPSQITNLGGKDFVLELMRTIDGVPDREDWLLLGPELFPEIRRLFKHPLLTEARLTYNPNVDMRFRKKAY